MGYSTDFMGQFNFSSPLTEEHKQYLIRFSATRRMKRDSEKLQAKYKGKFSKDGDYGKEGEFFALKSDNYGQTKDETVIAYNHPPKTQPGMWCQWVPNEEGTAIEWDGNEKFYDFEKWIKYLIKNILSPWGYVLNGTVKWQGENMNDRGEIWIHNNVVTVTDLE